MAFDLISSLTSNLSFSPVQTAINQLSRGLSITAPLQTALTQAITPTPLTPAPQLVRSQISPSVPTLSPGSILGSVAQESVAPAFFAESKSLNTPRTINNSMAFELSQLAQYLPAAAGLAQGVAGNLGAGRGSRTVVAVGRKYILYRNNITGKMSVSSRVPTRRFAHRSRPNASEKMMSQLLPLILITSLHK